eukprot:1155877-Pelagomonas_calceolata.AAC.2
MSRALLLMQRSDLVTRPCLPVLLRLVVRAAAHLALYSTAMEGQPSPKLVLSSRRMAVAVHCQSLYLSLIMLRVSLSQHARSFSEQGVTGKAYAMLGMMAVRIISIVCLGVAYEQARFVSFLGHGDFYPEVGKGIPRANELDWFALDQDLVFEQASGKVCHRRIASELHCLWARK